MFRMASKFRGQYLGTPTSCFFRNQLHFKVFQTIYGSYYDVFNQLEKYLNKTIDYKTFFNPSNCYKNDLMAADNQHPGKDWHIKFGNEFYEFIKDKL